MSFCVTAGLMLGDPVERTGKPLSVELGPGIMDNIFDGIQRPLRAIADLSKSCFIPRGVSINALDHSKKWLFEESDPKRRVGDLLSGGDIYGHVQENELIDHKLMVPPGMSGTVAWIAERGEYTLEVCLTHLRKFILMHICSGPCFEAEEPH
jgi:vacuolar-type H+-ATPase catalytic subunit A/Vma1